jgi:predicted RNase H-like HicB family nuclease
MVRPTAQSLPVVLRPGEDGWTVAECPVIPGCISQGRGREDALANIREAIELCLETREEEGLVAEGRSPVTVPLHRELDRGTLRSILRMADLSAEELHELL